ncbi:MAG: histone [archaeon]|jgi:histone H3/H4
MVEIAVAAADRIIRKSSGLRVSEDAAKLLAEHLEEMGMKIAGDASLFSKHAKRKTINKDDIKLAIKK